MEMLIKAVKKYASYKGQLPFSIYTSHKEQTLKRMTIYKPLIVLILKGHKVVSSVGGQHICDSGNFLFLGHHPEIGISNIPDENDEYLALFIEFEFEDFAALPVASSTPNNIHFTGSLKTPNLHRVLMDFIEWLPGVSTKLWSRRRQEIIDLLCLAGYEKQIYEAVKPHLHHRLIEMFQQDFAVKWTLKDACRKLSMSESTLRRHLASEGISFRELNKNIRLDHSLHLLQTTFTPVSIIAEQCGYQSFSRFTERFTERFGMSPSQLRQTRLL